MALLAPSSKVRATVLPAPGAEVRTVLAGVGQPGRVVELVVGRWEVGAGLVAARLRGGRAVVVGAWDVDVAGDVKVWVAVVGRVVPVVAMPLIVVAGPDVSMLLDVVAVAVGLGVAVEQAAIGAAAARKTNRGETFIAAFLSPSLYDGKNESERA